MNEYSLNNFSSERETLVESLVASLKGDAMGGDRQWYLLLMLYICTIHITIFTRLSARMAAFHSNKQLIDERGRAGFDSPVEKIILFAPRGIDL